MLLPLLVSRLLKTMDSPPSGLPFFSVLKPPPMGVNREGVSEEVKEKVE